MNVGILMSKNRLIKYTIGFVVTLALSTVLLSSNPTYAVSIDDGTKNVATSYTSYVALSGCAKNRLQDSIKTDPSNASATDPSKWFGPDINSGDSHIYPNGTSTKCGDVFSKAASLWGITDYGKFLKDMGYTLDISVPEYKYSGSSDSRRTAFENQIKSRTVNGSRPDNLSDSAKYAIYISSLEGDCKGVDVGAYASAYKSYADTGKRDGDYIYAKVVTPEGDRVFKRLFGKSLIMYGYVSNVSQSGGTVRDIDCGTINDTVNATAGAYTKTKSAELCKTTGPKYTDTSLVNACANGVVNKSNAVTFCKDTYRGVYSAGSGNDQKGEREACFVGQGNGGGGQCVDSGYETVAVLQACINGVKNKGDTAYCNRTYPTPDNLNMSGSQPKDTNLEKRKACETGQTLTAAESIDPISTECNTYSSQDCETTTQTTSCAVEGVGWIVCPVVNFLAGITDSIYGIIEGFLIIDVKTVASSTDSGSYQAWTIMRNIANVLLVIAFIIIVYSQLTGAGVSNYGIKKTLPRLIVTALLINLSFFICQIAVDLSNIIGGSLKIFLSNLPVFTTPDGNWAQDVLAQGNFFTDTAVAILGGQATIALVAGAATAGYFLGLGIFIPIVIAAVVAIIMTFFILLTRQMLVIILIVVAPIAIAAMLLPNTDKWFKWWRKAFVGVLVIYPLIAILFGGSQLAANILVQTKPGDLGWQLAAAAVAIMPLFFVPALLKGSLNAVPALGGFAQKIQAKAVGGARSATGKGIKKLGEYSAASNNKFGKGISGALHGNGRMGRLRQAGAQRAYEEPRMKDLMTQWTKPGKNNTPAIADDMDALAAIASKSPSSFEGQAAISMLAGKNDAVTLAKVRNGFKGDASKMAAYNKAIASNYGALKAKHPGAVQDMDSKAWSGVKQAEMQGMKDAALDEGVAASSDFRLTLTTAMQDSEQERHFTREMYSKMGITPPSEIKKQSSTQGGATSTTPAGAGAPARQPSTTAPGAMPPGAPTTTPGAPSTGPSAGTGAPTVAPTTIVPSSSSSSAPFVVGGNGSISIPHNNNNNSGTPPPTTP
jgi:hypothetical protein